MSARVPARAMTKASRVALGFVASLCVLGCKKKPDAVSGQDDPPPPPGTLTALTAPPGPAYVSLGNGGVARFERNGWELLPMPSAGWVDLSLGIDGTLWAFNAYGLWRFDGKEFVPTVFGGAASSAAAASDGSLWMLVSGELRHLADGAWTTDVVPGGDPVRGIARASEGIWVHTLDRTFRGSTGHWQPFDVPGVTGAMHDIYSLTSDGGSGVYLVTSAGVMMFDGRTWQPVRLPEGRAIDVGMAIVPGPQGRFAITGTGENYIGAASHGLRKIDLSPINLDARNLRLLGFDATGRLWTASNATLIVLDPNGGIVKSWSREEAPVLDSNIADVAVVAGGPAQFTSGERATGRVTGKIEGSAAGMRVVTCATGVVTDRPPCEGVATAREAMTTAGGRFTLDGVAVAPTHFWVQRNGRWRETQGTPCCAQLPPDGTIDVGTLTFVGP